MIKNQGLNLRTSTSPPSDVITISKEVQTLENGQSDQKYKDLQDEVDKVVNEVNHFKIEQKDYLE